eukprot:1161098-Pelagomonas_calceolata.AAC.7
MQKEWGQLVAWLGPVSTPAYSKDFVHTALVVHAQIARGRLMPDSRTKKPRFKEAKICDHCGRQVNRANRMGREAEVNGKWDIKREQMYTGRIGVLDYCCQLILENKLLVAPPYSNRGADRDTGNKHGLALGLHATEEACQKEGPNFLEKRHGQ